jgi:ribosomal protein S15P/S13E
LLSFHAAHSPGQFACQWPDCRKTFHRADGLKRHLDTHNKDKNLKR